MRDDGRPGLGHIGGVEVCEVHGEEEVGGGRWMEVRKWKQRIACDM